MKYSNKLAILVASTVFLGFLTIPIISGCSMSPFSARIIKDVKTTTPEQKLYAFLQVYQIDQANMKEYSASPGADPALAALFKDIDSAIVKNARQAVNIAKTAGVVQGCIDSTKETKCKNALLTSLLDNMVTQLQRYLIHKVTVRQALATARVLTK